MKTTLSLLTLCLLFLLSTTAAFGQGVAAASVLDSQPQIVHLPSHDQVAARQPMATERSLLGTGGYTYAQGERPLWEVGPKPVEVSLGDVARNLRKQHDVARKADKCFEN